MRTIVLFTALALFASTPVFAHVHLETSTPAANAKLAEAPAEITLDLSEAIEPIDAKGARIDKSDVHTAPDNAKRLIVSINAPGPGVCKVTWHVLSVDTHKTQGSFSFSVGK